MRGDTIVANQRLMTQAVFALADHLASAASYQLEPVSFANLPSPPQVGMIACITDFGTGVGAPNWGQTASGGGTRVALIWYNGTNWTVIGQ